MMHDRGFDISNGLTDEMYATLYSDDSSVIYEEFLSKLIDILIDNKKEYVVIESLYRSEMGKYFKKIFNEKAINIYIECDFDTRVRREYERLINLGEEVTYNFIEKLVKSKDQFKIERGVLEVKQISDVIINNTNLSFDEYNTIIKEVFIKINNQYHL